MTRPERAQLELVPAEPLPPRQSLGPGALLLRGFVAGFDEPRLLADLAVIVEKAPFRHMVTPSGHRMSAAMTNCGALGWVSDRAGYRYTIRDPASDQPWPPLPVSFLRLAEAAAAEAGFDRFLPDGCLINRYEPGARLTLHQDRNERDDTQPIVSVSLGIGATFLFGGETRADRPLRIRLHHGDVVVWGGPARLRFHGVAPIADDAHPILGPCRINLTFRKAG